MTALSWIQGIGIAGAESLGLALLAVLLFHAHRRVGIIPFVAYVTLLAAAVPSVIHQSVLEAGPLGSIPRVQATAAPVIIALVVFLHLTRGWRNAQLSASSVLIVTGFVSAVAALAPLVELGVGQRMLPADPLLPLAGGLLVWAGAMAASLSLLGLYRFSAHAPPILAVLGGTFVGLLVQGGGVVALAWAGFVIPGSSGLGPLVIPAIVGIAPLLAIGLYATMQLSGIWPETRRALISREPIGSSSELDEARDLQERFRQTRQEEQSEADTYRQLVESAEHGAYACTREGRITYANRALARILEQPDRDLEGENIRHVLGGTNERGRPRFVDYPVQVGTHRTTVQLPNGHVRSIEITVEPVGDGQLQGRVRDRTEEVLRAKLEEQKDRAEFYVDLLRHDIGNYVMTPLNYLTLVERRDDIPEEVEDYLEASRASVEDIADLLRRIDVLSEVDELTPEPVDAGQILRSVGRRFKEKHGSELAVTYAGPEGPVAVAGSPLLEDVFVNLLGNAIRHAGTDARIELSARREGTDWVLSVADDGPGIPDAEKAGIFDRNRRDETQNGKGLGLYIVRTITHAMGGKAWVEDRVPGEPAEGACFKVRLPAVDPSRLGEEQGWDVQGSSDETGAAA